MERDLKTLSRVGIISDGNTLENVNAGCLQRIALSLEVNNKEMSKLGGVIFQMSQNFEILTESIAIEMSVLKQKRDRRRKFWRNLLCPWYRIFMRHEKGTEKREVQHKTTTTAYPMKDMEIVWDVDRDSIWDRPIPTPMRKD
jgi:hypothetical protein